MRCKRGDIRPAAGLRSSATERCPVMLGRKSRAATNNPPAPRRSFFLAARKKFPALTLNFPRVPPAPAMIPALKVALIALVLILLLAQVRPPPSSRPADAPRECTCIADVFRESTLICARSTNHMRQRCQHLRRSLQWHDRLPRVRPRFKCRRSSITVRFFLPLLLRGTLAEPNAL